MTNTVELKVLDSHKAEGIKELCFRAINNPDPNFIFWGVPNTSFGERRETLLNVRKQATRALADLEKESDDLLNGKAIDEFGRPITNKTAIVSKLDSIMNVISILDKYNIENTKKICKKTEDTFVHLIGHANVNFPITFDGDDVVVSCQYYEDISLNDRVFAEYTEIDDEEQQIEFLKKHVELGNVSILSKEEAELLNNFNPAKEIEPPHVEPIFANVDEAYQIEVDK